MIKPKHWLSCVSNISICLLPNAREINVIEYWQMSEKIWIYLPLLFLPPNSLNPLFSLGSKRGIIYYFNQNMWNEQRKKCADYCSRVTWLDWICCDPRSESWNSMPNCLVQLNFNPMTWSGLKRPFWFGSWIVQSWKHWMRCYNRIVKVQDNQVI